MLRATWKGVIESPLGEIPVKLYSAAVERSVHFRLLSRKDGQPVHQEMINPETGEVVPSEEIRRGVELDDGRFVMLDKKELAALEPKSSREIDVVGFVPEAAIAPAYYERPYYLAPEQGGEKKYAALRDALAAEQAAGLVRWVMRKRAYRGALRADGELLTLVTLRTAEEVIDLPHVEPKGPQKVGDKELKMAEQLVMALAGPFEPDAYHDTYRERVEELAARKARGEKVKLPTPIKRRPARSLESALAASLKAHKEAHVG